MAKGTLVFPPEIRAVARPDARAPLLRLPLSGIKAKRRCFAWFKEWFIRTLNPVLGRDWLLLAAAMLFALLIFFWNGASEIPTGISSWWAEKQALLWALPIYLVLTAIIAFRVSMRNEGKKGKWLGTKFLYFEPQLALTTEWKPADNGSLKAFRVKDAEPCSLVHYKLEIEGPAHRVWGALLGKYRLSPEERFVAHGPLAPRGKVVVGNDRKLELRCYSEPKTVPVIVRVYLLSWEMFAEEGFEFEQEQTALRCVMKLPQ